MASIETTEFHEHRLNLYNMIEYSYVDAWGLISPKKEHFSMNVAESDNFLELAQVRKLFTGRTEFCAASFER